MRYIDLRKGKRKSSVHAVLKLGCGPNFVKNRSEAFEQMIKEQIDDELPGWTTSLLKDLHRNFVEGERAVDYCWNVVFETGPPMKRVNSILDEIYQFVAMEFASALGEVFFKWLVAEELNGQAKEYWKIPDVYLTRNFQPGALEKFLVAQWGKKLLHLLGVPIKDVCWIRTVMSQKQTADSDYTMEFYEHAKSIRQRYKYVWKLKLKGMRKAIDNADELRKLHQNKAGAKITKPASEVKKPPYNSTAKQPQCSCCGTVARVKKCQVCVDENWRNPKYYCGISCQSKDWYEKHKKEHNKYMKRRKHVMMKANGKPSEKGSTSSIES